MTFQAAGRRTRVKICGMTRADDVSCAVQNGADAVGLVFYPKSPRAVSVAQARGLREPVPAFVDVVALLVNATRLEVNEIIEQVRPDLLQFHGDESPEFCTSFGRRYIRVFRVGAPGLSTPDQVLAQCKAYGDAAGWLFDSHSSGYGGSGRRFDAALLQAVLAHADSRPVILAGGLSVAGVADSLHAVQPFAVDVSSGVESAPGIKSHDKIAAFLRAVRAYDGQRPGF